MGIYNPKNYIYIKNIKITIGGVLSIQQQKIKTLMDLGLTLQESKIYCALVKIGPTRVSKISKTSQISRADAYRTAKKLERLGLIEKIISKPVVYDAVEPKVAINFLLDCKLKNFEEVKLKSYSLLKDLEKKVKNKPHEKQDETIWIPSKQALIERIKQSVDKTQRTIEILTTNMRLTQACYTFCNCLDNAWSRNVKCRVLVQEPTQKQLTLFKKAYPKPCCEFCFFTHKPLAVIAIYDDKEVFVITNIEATLKNSSSLWSSNKSIVGLAKHYFETMWKSSKPLSTL